jgi:hypothetical protein
MSLVVDREHVSFISTMLAAHPMEQANHSHNLWQLFYRVTQKSSSHHYRDSRPLQKPPNL